MVQDYVTISEGENSVTLETYIVWLEPADFPGTTLPSSLLWPAWVVLPACSISYVD